MKTDANGIWREYERASSYNDSISLYETVQKCEDFYIGNQWKGLEKVDLDKPVFNILKRVVTFFVSAIVSDDIGFNLEQFESMPGDKALLDMVKTQLDQVMEQTKVKRLYRKMLRNASVDGDGCIHFYFDQEAETDGDFAPAPGGVKPTGGAIRAELLENYNVFFGNPQSPELEEQPFVLIRYRKTLDEAKEYARKAGAKEWQAIQPDQSSRGVNTAEEDGKVTVLRKYWRQDKTIYFCEICRECVLKEPTDTGYKLYPLLWMPWEEVKNSYHGMGAISALIPNQIFINKLYAMAMRHVQMCAFPKVVYNRSMLPGGWSNRVGEAIPVNGAPDMAVGQGLRMPDMSAQVLQMIAQTVSDTRDTMGASDASLGNIKPDNTSAIIATQKATSQPLELQRMNFFDCVERSVRIWLDMMSVNYGLRPVKLEQKDTATGKAVTDVTLYNFAQLRGLGIKLNVEIGASSYWSEIMQVQTLDALFANGILTDPVTYLKAVPDGYIKGKAEILKSVEEEKAAREEQAMLQMQGAQNGSSMEAGLYPGL